MIYKYINNKNNKLLIFFNDMIRVGIDDELFSSYNIIKNIFNDYDILFIKDIKPNYWYLTIIDDIYKLIQTISNNYIEIYGLTSSSGTLCLLNILYKFNNFKKAVIINGQTTLQDDILEKYKYNCYDCAIFNKNYINEIYNNEYLVPFNKILPEMFQKYIFYYCNSVSDKIYYEYIKSIYPTNLYNNLFFNDTITCHGKYVAFLLNDTNFLQNIKSTFDNLIFYGTGFL